MTTSLTEEERASLRKFLAERFSLGELKVLAFDLGVDYDSLPHNTKDELSIGLLTYFEHRDNLGYLVSVVGRQRPDPYIEQLSLKLSGYSPRQKVQIKVSEDDLEKAKEILEYLAEKLNVDKGQVSLIRAAGDEPRLLVSLPQEAAERLAAETRSLADDKYRIGSITPFDKLDTASQNAWRLLASRYEPPLSVVSVVAIVAIVVIALVVLALIFRPTTPAPTPPPTNTPTPSPTLTLVPLPTPTPSPVLSPTPTSSPTPRPTSTPSCGSGITVDDISYIAPQMVGGSPFASLGGWGKKNCQVKHPRREYSVELSVRSPASQSARFVWGISTPPVGLEINAQWAMSLWLKGQQGGEVVKVGVKDYDDVIAGRTVTATTEWAVVVIPLADLEESGVNLYEVSNVFIDLGDCPAGGTVYVDEIAFQPVATWEIKGASLTGFSSEVYASRESENLVDHFTELGANYVSVLVTEYQDGQEATQIRREPGRTPTDESLRQIIQYAHRQGLNVLLHLQVDDLHTDDFDKWRGNFNPASKASGSPVTEISSSITPGWPRRSTRRSAMTQSRSSTLGWNKSL